MEKLNFNHKRDGCLNASDLNRIEEWTQFLSKYLYEWGYPVFVKTREWKNTDIPWQNEIDRIRNNTIKLYEAYRSLPDWRDISFTNSLDNEQVNAIEWDLNAIYTWLNNMVLMFSYSNEIICNEGGVL